MSTLQTQHKNGYALIQIDNGKVNAINTELARDLRDTFLKLEKDTSVKGVVLIGKPHCFSAGLDVMQMATGTIDQTIEFWTIYMEAFKAMIRFSKPFVCGITGFAPAGGTAIALCADYRIMGKGEKHVIGLNEFKMSLMIPEIMGDIYAYHLGEKAAWEAVQSAKLFRADEAVAVGLVNEAVEVEEVVEKAEARMQKMLKILPSCYSKSKAVMRKGLLEVVNRDFEPMLDVLRKHAEDPMTRKLFEMFLAKLKK